MEMKKNLYRKAGLAAFCAAICVFAAAFTVRAADASYETKGSRIYFQPGDSAQKNRQVLNEALQTKGATVILPKKTFHIDTALRPGNNVTIQAEGATVISDRGAFTNDMNPSVSGRYAQLKNVTIKGGTWKTTNLEKSTVSMFSIAHASNIKILNVTIQSHADGHAVELIGCKNVTIKNSKMVCKGKPSKEHRSDEQIQIDLATPVCSPRLNQTPKFQDGTTCENIRIEGCEVKGPRGICANLSREKKFLTRYHKNIIIKNNKVTSMTAEAIMIFNTAGVTIVGNTAVSNAARTDNRNFNTGIHVMLNAKPPKSVQQSTVLIARNKARGRHIGILLYSTDMKYSFGTVKILKNRYYSEDKEDAMFVPKEIVKKLTISGNKYAK